MIHRPNPIPARRARCLRRVFTTAGAAAAMLLLGTAHAKATPIISEVLYDAVGSDDGQLFVEIAGTPGTVLDGLLLEGVNGSNGAVGPVVALAGTIGPDGLFVLAEAMSDGTTLVPVFDQLASFDFQNGPDSIRLTDGITVLDAVGYGTFGAGEVFAGEGMPTLDVAAGWSLARLYADVDTDDNSVDFVGLDVPTPGSADFLSVPEPGSGLLAGTGLATLGWMRRRSRPVPGKRSG